MIKSTNVIKEIIQIRIWFWFFEKVFLKLNNKNAEATDSVDESVYDDEPYNENVNCFLF